MTHSKIIVAGNRVYKFIVVITSNLSRINGCYNLLSLSVPVSLGPNETTDLTTIDVFYVSITQKLLLITQRKDLRVKEIF